MSTVLIVTGWRAATAERHGDIIADALTPYRTHGHVTLRHGKCPYGGVDLIAANLAVGWGWTLEEYPPEIRDGRILGPARNRAMCAAQPRADTCLAFPGPGLHRHVRLHPLGRPLRHPLPRHTTHHERTSTVTTDRAHCPARPDRIHGTTWAYKQWGCRCPDALRAMATVWARRRANFPLQSTALPGIAHNRTWDYDQLSVDAALDRVRRHVGPPPLLTSPERRAVIARLTKERWTAGQIGRALGLSQRGVQRHRKATAANQAAA